MAELQIKDLSHTHEAFMDWMLLNPHRSLGEMAAVFGYTQAWVSVVVNSDIFRQRLAERRGDINVRVGQTTVEKMQAVADLGLERLMDMMPSIADPELVVSATDKMLARLGYTHKAPPGAATVVNNNVYVISKEKLANLRGVITNGNAERVDRGSTSAGELAAPAGDNLGSICVDASDISAAAEQNRSTEARGEV